MSKTNKDINKYRGYVFYKVDENDSVELLRIVDIEEFNDKVVVKKENGITKTMTIGALSKYTPLEPTGFIMFTRVTVNGQDGIPADDIIASVYRLIDVKMDINEPYAICRQNVTDFFYSLISTDEDHEQVGVSCSRDTCPGNIPYHVLACCDSVLNSTMVNFYLNDTLEDILQCINPKELSAINSLLEENYITHMRSNNPMYMSRFDENMSDKGWCRNLHQLLFENNFITDLDTMRNITSLDFDLSKYLKEEDTDVYSFNEIMLLFFNDTFKINATTTMVIKYDFDINLGDFNNSHYTLLRDNTNTVYVVVYTSQGEYLEKDLEAEYNRLGVSDRLRLAYFNKYSES